MDGDERWIKYSRFFIRNLKYIEYIKSVPMLDILLISLTQQWPSQMSPYIDNMNAKAITTITPTSTMYLDIRYLGLPLSRTIRGIVRLKACVRWYNDLNIPNKQEYYYVLECTVESWVDVKHTSVVVRSKLLGKQFVMTSASVTFFCYPAPSLTSAMKLVDAAFLKQYPGVLSKVSKKKGHNYDRGSSSSSTSHMRKSEY